MTDIVIFAFEFLATAMCASAIHLLVWAAHQDGPATTPTIRLRRTTGSGRNATTLQPEPVRVAGRRGR